ncbi:hypothetical protein Tco_1376823, partial [Tanacetum coccineum]
FVNDKVAAGGYRQVKVLEFFDCSGPRQGVEDLRELLHKFLICGSALETSLLDFLVFRFVNDKVAAGGYRQVKVLEFFDCPGPRQGVEDLRELLHKVLCLIRGVHRVHDEKRIWFVVELHGAQGDREAEVFQVSNDDTIVAQRRLEDKEPEEKINTDCLVKEQEKEYQAGDIAAEWSGLSKGFWAEDTTMSTYLVNRSSSSAIGFKTPVDMLRFFGWLASIKQGMLEPVKVKCIFLGYRKVHDREQHSAWELFSYREDSNKAAFVVAALDMIYAHESLTFNNIVACEVISKWEAGLKDDMDASSDVYVLSNGCKKCSDDSDDYYWEYTRDFVEGNSMLSLKDSLSGDCDVEKNASALQVLRRLGSIFTSVYAAKLKRVVSLLEGLQGGKKIVLYQKE